MDSGVGQSGAWCRAMSMPLAGRPFSIFRGGLAIGGLNQAATLRGEMSLRSVFVVLGACLGGLLLGRPLV